MPDPISVLVFTQTPISEPLIERLRAVSPRLRVEARVAPSLEELGDVWRGVEVLYTSWFAPTPQMAPDLRWVQGQFAGVDHFLDNPVLQQAVLTTTSGIHAPNIGEYVLMMMLAFGHRLPRLLQYQQKSEWPQDRYPLFAPVELCDCTVGIVGYGSIGRQVARLARAFGMRVLATKRNIASADPGWHLPGLSVAEQPDRLYPPAELKAMLAESDYVVLLAPLTPETKKMIGAAELAAMKPGAVLINVARGGLVDEPALIEALRAGTLGGAALDVFTREPLPADNPLWTLPNVILTPHVGGITPHYDERAMGLFAENLRRYVAGEPLLNVVDLKKGY